MQQNKKLRSEKAKKKVISLFEIFILVISLVAFSYFIGEEFGVVKAAGPTEECKVGTKITVTAKDGLISTLTKSSQGWDCIPSCYLTKNGQNFYLQMNNNFCNAYVQAKNPIVSSPDGTCSPDGTFKCFPPATTKTDTTTVNAGEQCKSTCHSQGYTYGFCRDTCYAPNNELDIGKQDCKTAKCCCNKKQETNGLPVTDLATSAKCGSIDGVSSCKVGDSCAALNMDNGDGFCVSGKCCKPKSTTDGTTSGAETGLFGIPIGAKEVAGSIFEGFIWAAAVYTGIKLVGPMLGLGENEVDAAAVSLSAGFWLGKTLFNLEIIKDSTTAILAGAGAALLIFALIYRQETTEVITFNCLPWQAPTKGNNCQLCNEQGVLPCSEYQCRSLGQACQLLNKGTADEKCAWVNQNDISFPTIEPWLGVLTEGYRYTPDNTISPPDRGVNIRPVSTSEDCIEAFTPLVFGINTNEPAKCKLDVSKKNNFEEMSFFFSSGLLLQNHSYTLSLPGAAAMESENITIQNDGNYSLYVRCEDANGNFNTADFVFRFCVDKGPDATPPLIVKTSIPTGNPIASGQTNVSIEVYVNEPVEGCSWDRLDQSYENMENTMDCTDGNQINDMNAQGFFTCVADLDGLKDSVANDFYFRCQDVAGNADRESYKYTLIGTKPLVIDSVAPNGTVKDATERVRVTLKAHTFAGYKDGEAQCYYSNNGEEGSYIKFFNTGSFEHSQDLDLSEGDYIYYIRCLDLAGNADTKTTSFRVESDLDTPVVIRAYHEETNLKIITDKAARCVYDVLDCTYNFADGVEMTSTDQLSHYVQWDTNNDFYIKCEDVNGNLPNPDECSIIVRPYTGY